MSNHAIAVASPPGPAVSRNGARPLPADIRKRIEHLFACAGLQGAAETLGISQNALARALAGAPVARGTVASVKLALMGTHQPSTTTSPRRA